MKNKYLVENKEIIFRRAYINDNLEEIASLIYKTDPFIYPFWFNNDMEEAIKCLTKLIASPASLFSVDNIYVAINKENNKIIGALVAIDKSVYLCHNYDLFRNINSRYDFTIDNYIIPVEREIDSFDDHTIYISNVCVDEHIRGKGIGSYLLGYFISQMEKQGFDVFHLDCLLHNLRAKNLYHAMGFKEMKLITGFDGTDHSKVEVVSFLRKKGNYYPEDFKVK